MISLPATLGQQLAGAVVFVHCPLDGRKKIQNAPTRINDQRGFAMPDRLFRIIARRLQGCVVIQYGE